MTTENLAVLPAFISELISRIGITAAREELFHREQICRDEMLYWKQYRQSIDSLIQSQLDSFSDIAEETFNADY